MQVEISNRPLTEIRINLDSTNSDTIIKWLEENSKFLHSYHKNEFIILLPHPKHKILGGMNIEEFLSDCPDLLNPYILNQYNEKIRQREDSNSEFDLNNDFGFILVSLGF